MSGRRLHLYSVYDRKDKCLPVILDGSAAECAAVMGVDRETFYQYLVRRDGDGICGRWEIHASTEKEILEVLG